MAIGPALILLNKYIMERLDFPYPMFLSGCEVAQIAISPEYLILADNASLFYMYVLKGIGVFSSGLVAHLLVFLRICRVEKQESVEGFLYMKRVLPVGEEVLYIYSTFI
jgi:hypothetical protein